MEVSEYQVYIRNLAPLIRKKFRKTCDPKSSRYGMFSKSPVIDKGLRESVIAYLESQSGVEWRSTMFDDVLLVTASRETLFGELLPKEIERVESYKGFKDVVRHLKGSFRNISVEVLPRIPKLSAGLKERLDLECMIQGMQGRSLLAYADSVWGEMPSVTVFAESIATLFSGTFDRKKSAAFQHHYVNTYLWDPEIKSQLREIQFHSTGRASPDIFLDDLPKFIFYLRKQNAKRVKRGLPTIGYLNYFLYQNAHAFQRPLTDDQYFPDSVALWSANRGLGAPHYYGLREAIRVLPGPKTSMWARATAWMKRGEKVVR